jgi:hypothetical protein
MFRAFNMGVGMVVRAGHSHLGRFFRMKKQVVMAGALLLSASVLSAQANTCPAGGPSNTIGGAQANVTRDACLQAVDVFQFMAPQLGLSLAGGNATLGQEGAFGGLGHFAVSIRANAFRGDLPEVNKFGAPRATQNPPAQVLPSKKQYLALPVVDAAFGVFKGFPVGLTNVGGIDLLVSATYVPKIGDANDDVQLEPQSSTQFGWGARVGLLQESLVIPGVSATYFRRDVPKTDITGRSTSVTLNIDDASVKTSAWRVVVGKSFVLFGLAAGYGQDTYDQSTTVSGTVNGFSVPGVGSIGNTPFGPIKLSQDVTRSNMFADLSVNLFLFKLVGEIGQVSGGDFAATTNTFSSGKIDDSRVYGSVGLRFGW